MTKNQELNTRTIAIEGGCHCGAVKFQAKVKTDTVILKCNCSMCSMTGFHHLIVPHQQFTLMRGKNQLSSYQFNTKQANHLFCKHCGVKSYYQPRSHPDCWSINTHCIKDFNETEWSVKPFDGQNWAQAKQNLKMNHD